MHGTGGIPGIRLYGADGGYGGRRFYDHTDLALDNIIMLNRSLPGTNADASDGISKRLSTKTLFLTCGSTCVPPSHTRSKYVCF